jgi:hypothetical protein
VVRADDRPVTAPGVPTVCVALSVKDGGAYLPESIESVLAQQDVALELRIYDNGSTDGSFQVYERYRDDPRVLVTANPAGSTFYDSMNLAIAETAAPWLVAWAADDVMLPQNLATKLAAAERARARLAFTPVVSLDARGVRGRTLCDEAGGHELVFDPPSLLDRIAPWNTIPMPAVLAETDALREVGGFESRLRLCGDWMMWLRLSLRVRTVYVPEPGVLYREHEGNATHNARRAGTFPVELVSTLRAAYEDPAFPLDARWTFRDHLLAILTGQASSQIQHGLVRAADCPHAAYVLAFEALLHAPDEGSVQAAYRDAVMAAGLPATRAPFDVAAAPGRAPEEIASSMQAIRRLMAHPGLAGRVQIAAHPGAVDGMVELIEQDLAQHGDLELELTAAPDVLALLQPGGIFVVPLGDPRAAAAEGLHGATVTWERWPDPLAFEAAAEPHARRQAA